MFAANVKWGLMLHGQFTHNKIVSTKISAIITVANKQGQKTEMSKVYGDTK